MNTLTKNILWGAAIGAGTGITVDLLQNRNKKPEFTFIPDRDHRNSETLDDIESVNAKFDSSEIGLSQLDSTYREEWQGMGYPQTHKNIQTDDE